MSKLISADGRRSAVAVGPCEHADASAETVSRRPFEQCRIVIAGNRFMVSARTDADHEQIKIVKPSANLFFMATSLM